MGRAAPWEAFRAPILAPYLGAGRAPMIQIQKAETQFELDDVRALMREFVQWHRDRHVEDHDLIERYFDPHDFDAELANLPGKYEPPRGSLIVAYDDNTPVGCVAMRDLGDGACEMKRMYVPERARGRGIGRRLAERIVADARAAGYRYMRLDTSKRQSEAMRLYERSGFVRIPAYYPVEDPIKDWLVFFELAL
jgi:GNAT superfamily N-acetyltransferase